MTPDQERLVVDNVARTHQIARKLFPLDDEYQGVAVEALCRAAGRWVADAALSERYGTFALYLWLVVRRDLFDFHRQWHRESPRFHRRIHRRSRRILSLDADDGEALLDGEALRERDLADVVAETVDNEAVIAQIKPRVRVRARRRADGYSLSEIGAEAGVSGAAVCHSFLLEAHRLARTADRQVVRGTLEYRRKPIRRSA